MMSPYQIKKDNNQLNTLVKKNRPGRKKKKIYIPTAEDIKQTPKQEKNFLSQCKIQIIRQILAKQIIFGLCNSTINNYSQNKKQIAKREKIIYQFFKKVSLFNKSLQLLQFTIVFTNHNIQLYYLYQQDIFQSQKQFYTERYAEEDKYDWFNFIQQKRFKSYLQQQPKESETITNGNLKRDINGKDLIKIYNSQNLNSHILNEKNQFMFNLQGEQIIDRIYKKQKIKVLNPNYELDQIQKIKNEIPQQQAQRMFKNYLSNKQ